MKSCAGSLLYLKSSPDHLISSGDWSEYCDSRAELNFDRLIIINAAASGGESQDSYQHHKGLYPRIF